MFYGTTLVLAMALGQADMTSTPEQFQEFGKLVIGRWSGDVTLIADWPGMKKKAGEKLINYRSAHWVADGKAFVDTAVGGETTSTAPWIYEPVTKKIVLLAIHGQVSRSRQWSGRRVHPSGVSKLPVAALPMERRKRVLVIFCSRRADKIMSLKVISPWAVKCCPSSVTHIRGWTSKTARRRWQTPCTQATRRSGSRDRFAED